MTSFDDFVKKQNEKAKPVPAFNPQERIDTFKKHVEEFYNSVCNEWLKDNIEKGLIKTSRQTIRIHEESLGFYEIDALNITIGDIVVNLRPIGTILIGTRGRIDISYRSRSGMFVLTGENIESPRAHIAIRVNGEMPPKQKDPGREVWKFVDRRGMMSYVSLNAEVFQEIIMELING